MRDDFHPCAVGIQESMSQGNGRIQLRSQSSLQLFCTDNAEEEQVGDGEPARFHQAAGVGGRHPLSAGRGWGREPVWALG